MEAQNTPNSQNHSEQKKVIQQVSQYLTLNYATAWW
jgi:hypothetical protein